MSVDLNSLVEMQKCIKFFDLDSTSSIQDLIPSFELYVARFNSKSYKLEHAVYLNTLDIVKNKPETIPIWFELIKAYVIKNPEKTESDSSISIFDYRYKVLPFLNRIIWNETSDIIKLSIDDEYIDFKSNLKELIFNKRAKNTKAFEFVYDYKQKEFLNEIGIDNLAKGYLFHMEELLDNISASQAAKIVFNPISYKNLLSDKTLSNPMAVELGLNQYVDRFDDFKGNNPNEKDYMLLYLFLNSTMEYFKTRNSTSNVVKIEKLITNVKPKINESIWNALVSGFDISDNIQATSALEVACGMYMLDSKHDVSNLDKLEF